MNVNEWLEERTILKTVAGSYSYGTSLPTSDKDFKGVCVSPLEIYLGFSLNFEQSEKSANKGAEADETIYEIQKFFHLCGLGNPNCLESLYVVPEDILVITSQGQKLIDNRNLFLSKRLKYTMEGYATAQWARIENHRRWLRSPMEKPPERKDFGLENNNHKLSKDEAGAIDALIDKGHSFAGELMDLVTKEKKYRQAMKDWESFNRWKATRNPVRFELEEKHQMDTKHLSHLVRLMRMCEEILSGKEMIVRRPDAKELLEIRNGAWTFEQAKEWFEKQKIKCNELVEKCPWPKSPDYKKLDALCMEIILEMK